MKKSFLFVFLIVHFNFLLGQKMDGIICEEVLASKWGAGPWNDEVISGKFIANSANDAVLATGDGDLTVEIFEGDCNGATIGVYNTVSSGEIERVVVGDLITGQEYSYNIYGGDNVQSKVKTYANSRIRENECGQIFQLEDQIHALREIELYENPAVQVTGFTYRFQDVETDEVTLEVRNQVDGHSPQLSTIPGLLSGYSYNVQVSHRVLQIANGVVSEMYSDYGTSCTIHIQGVGEPVLGCLDPIACNYNVEATIDDGSCYRIGDFCGDGELEYYYYVDCNCECVFVSDFPGFYCPESVSVTSDFGECLAYVEVPQPESSDPLYVYVNDYNGTSDATGHYPVGITVVIWVKTDECGNVSTCSQLVEVTDDIPPMMECQGGQVFEADSGLCYALAPNIIDPFVADECGIMSLTNNAPEVFSLGTSLVTWNVTDINGNSSSCQSEIIIEENELSSFGCLDEVACNFNPCALVDDGSCIYAIGNDECDGMGGVIDNPDVGDQCDDGDPNTINDVILLDFLCYGYPISGGACLDAEACNYNPLSSFDDGSCIFPGDMCDDGDPLTMFDALDVNCICVGVISDIGNEVKDAQDNLDGLYFSKIFPNPNRGNVFYVELIAKDVVGRVNCDLYNLLGVVVHREQFVYTKSRSILEINLQNQLSPGAYLLRIMIDEKSHFRKLIIEE